jgi:pyridoxamine 5'-phosphate oxidase
MDQPKHRSSPETAYTEEINDMSFSSKENMFGSIRKEYSGQRLLIENMPAHPLDQFDQWFADATRAQPQTCDAMTLATVDEQGLPDARMVLLKSYSKEGFCFFTNLKSRKSIELMHLPYACLVFYWSDLDRQVRVRGQVKRQNSNDEDRYFATRPLNAQLASWASKQSEPITEDELFERLKIAKKTQPLPVKRPPFWGGFRVLAQHYEFWQGQPDRLHDRIIYEAKGDNDLWIKQRLAP